MKPQICLLWRGVEELHISRISEIVLLRPMHRMTTELCISLCLSPGLHVPVQGMVMRSLRHSLCRGPAHLLKLMQREVLACLGSLCIDAAMLRIQDEHIAMLPLGRALQAACIRSRLGSLHKPATREHSTLVIKHRCLHVSTVPSKG